MLTSNPLVSIVIPAYKADFFEAALFSACSQTYDNLEIVVGDDNPSGAIAALVERQRGTSRVPIRYFHSQPALGEIPNAAACVEVARGKYIKFLHDDDELLPECVAALVAVMEGNPSIALASSRRVVINELGEISDLELPYLFPFAGDVLISGPQLVAFLARRPINFVGEPSCMLCRREDLLAFGDQMMSLQGKLIIGFGDMAMAARLFQRGDLALLAQPLTRYRVSRQQLSRVHRALLLQGRGQRDFTQSVYALGWAAPSDAGVMVDVAPLEQPSAVAPMDLYKAIADNYQRVKTVEHTRDWLAGRVPSAAQRQLIDEYLQRQCALPRLGVVIVNSGADAVALQRTLTSVEHQVIPGLVQHVLEYADAGGVPLAAQLNQLIHASDCDWFMLLRAGEEFTAAGLSTLAQELANAAQYAAIYADYVTCEPNGDLSVGLRPDFNLDFLLGHPAAMAQHWLFRRDAVVAAGGFADDHPQALEFELILRLVNQLGLHSFGHVPEPLLISPRCGCDEAAYLAAIEQHLLSRGYPQAQVQAYGGGRYAIDYGHTQQPLVSIIVVAGSDLMALQRCLMSVLEKTLYTQYELVVIDNGGHVPEVSQWLRDIEQLGLTRLHVRRPGRRCSASEARNLGSEYAAGEFLLFLSEQAVVFEGQWLHHLLNHGLRPEVAVVGAKCFSVDGKITHAGLIPGLFVGAGRVFFGVGADATGYMSRLLLDQNYSAVSQDCLLLRTALFRDAAGFDAAAFADEGADVDLCLRLGQQGYLVVWASRCLVLHEREAAAYTPATQQGLSERWLSALAQDPAGNLNFSLDEAGGAALGPLALNWRPLFNFGAPVVLAQADACSYADWHRLTVPLQAVQQAGMIQAALVAQLPGIVELQRFAVQTLLLHGSPKRATLEALRPIRALTGTACVYALDVVPETREDMQLLREILAEVDRVVVATPMLAEVGRHLHSDVRLIETRLNPAQWQRSPAAATERSTRPRVGWVGGAAEADDLALIAEVIKALSSEVDWVILGECPQALRGYIKALHPPVSAAQRAQALAALDLDLALVPLAPTLGNEFKGFEVLLELGACAYPVICSDMPGHRVALPVTRVSHTREAWLQAIEEQLRDPLALRQAGRRLHEAVWRDWMHDSASLTAWRNAWLGD